MKYKSQLIIIAAAVLGIALALVFVRQGDSATLNVNDVGSDPAAFSGTIAVTGIVGGISQQDPSIFGIMDKKELQCKTPGCNKLLIPVKYPGQQPVLGDEVRLTGRFVNNGAGYLLAAEKLKVVRHHKIGG